MPTLLMCPPDYYGIEYEINPWMDRHRAVIPMLAEQQWRELYRILTKEVGAKVELFFPVKGLPDLVFTANAGLVHGNTFISSNFRYSVRARESPYLCRWFEERGYTIIHLPEKYYFEGEGDILRCGENLFAGYRFRSDIRFHQRVGEIVGKRVLSLELIDPRFYHLDTCFCPLDNNSAVYYPGAFDSYGNKVIEEYIPERITVGLQDALRFGCNSIVVGKKVVMNAGCAELKSKLETEGYVVYETDLSEFIKSGGSAKCLALFLS